MIEQVPEQEIHAGEKAEFSHCPKGPQGPEGDRIVGWVQPGKDDDANA